MDPFQVFYCIFDIIISNCEGFIIFFLFLFTHLQVRDHLTLSGLQLIPMKVANVTVLNIKSKSKLGLKVSNIFKQRPTFCCRSFYLNESEYLSYFLLNNCNCFLNAKFIGNEYSMQFAFTWSRYIFRNSMFVKKKWVKPHEIWLFLRKTSKFNAVVWQKVGRSWRIYAWYLSGRMAVGHPIQNTCAIIVYISSGGHVNTHLQKLAQQKILKLWCAPTRYKCIRGR